MTAQTTIGYAARAAGAYAGFKYGARLVPALGAHPLILAALGWLAAGLVLDAAIPGKGD